MKVRMLVALGALGSLALLSAPPALAGECCHGKGRMAAHGCCGGQGQCPMMSREAAGAPGGAQAPGTGRTYDPDTVTTLRGTAGAVNVMPSGGGRPGGTHVTLEGEGRTLDVHLGPTWFLQREGLEVAKGDVLEVTGSVVDIGGGTALIAREVKKGQKVLTLRDERGVPAWSGARRP
jgi:hypothetical protein